MKKFIRKLVVKALIALFLRASAKGKIKLIKHATRFATRKFFK